MIGDRRIVFAQPLQRSNLCASHRQRRWLTYLSYFGRNNSEEPKLPFIFDAFGDIRWYLDYSSTPGLNRLNYRVGVERLRNGNLYFGDSSTHRIYEVDMLGEVINTWDIPGYRFHHNVQEKLDGDFLATVNRRNFPTIQDHIVEIDRNSKEIINKWDLNQSLDRDRDVFRNKRNTKDWIHVNAVIPDETDNTLIISSRGQGIFKLSRSNEVIWILSPHKGWGNLERLLI